ncbi:MAG: LAGLIDADG family homing endonuclease [Sulfuricaulis sp.]
MKVVQLQAQDPVVAEIPIQPTSLDIWDKKYRLKSKTGEVLDQDIAGTYARVARALANVETTPEKQEEWFEKFFWALQNGAIPAGRIISNAGALEHKPATSTINCTVSRAIPDSMDGILSSVHEAGLTLKAGCVAPGTWVVTERGLVTADQAVAERHAQILCYDRAAGQFEMRTILRHLITHVPRTENIEIVSNGVSLKTSIKHPVLVYRHNELIYTRADDVRADDALVHHRFAWCAETEHALEAWFAGAYWGDSSATMRQAQVAHARAYSQRLIFKIRAAKRELGQRCAAFFQACHGAQTTVIATATVNGAPLWDNTAASFEASNTAGHVDHRVGAKSTAQQVPAWIKANPEKYFLPFLAGLIDTDGTVNHENGSATIAMQCPHLATELKGLLALFGIHGTIIRRPLPRQLEYRDHVVNDQDGTALKISDSDFLVKIAEYMADSGKCARIHKAATQSGQHDLYILPQTLHEALEREFPGLSHVERQRLGFYHGYHRARVVSRIWLDRWEVRFPNLRALIGVARTLRPVETIRHDLDLPQTFYDFSVEKHNNYLAGNNGLMVIHNCGIGYEFSTLRPKGAFVSGAGAHTSGPLSFMDIFNAMCFTVSSAGGRRGAQMGTFDIAHPDIMDFIKAKREDGRLRQFNLSCLITDEFMQAVKKNASWDLVFPVNRHEYEDPESRIVWRYWPVTEGYITNNISQVACKVYKTVPAQRLWDLIMASTYDYAEPGFILIDKINEMNNNWFCENIRATNPCVTADTRLHTQYGLIPIGELYSAGVPLQATVDVRALGQDNHGTTVRPAVPAFMTARQADVYRVQTQDGYQIKATAWHDFYTTRGKIKLKDLRPDDELLIQSGKGQFGTEGNAELGTLIGLIAGDGHFTNRGKGEKAAIVNFWNEDRALAPAVAGYINTLIAGLATNSRTYRVEPVAVPSRHHVFLRSVLLARFLEHYGFTALSKYKSPEIVWRGTENCVKGYLRGLFQTDGTVQRDDNNHSCTIRLASSHENLLKDVQILLANFGIFCSIYKRRNTGQRLLPDGKGGKKLYTCQADYELIIGSESRDLFMEEIGFLTESKNNKYWGWRKQRSSCHTQSFRARVTAIEYHGIEAVFDTTQPDHNNLIFNGIVTGNCGEQPLPQYGSCLLGSVNLTRFVEDPFTDTARFNWERYREVVGVFTRLLDNVVEINGLPLERQRHEIHHKRRHGMGFLGLGSTLTMLRMKYGAPESLEFTERVAREMAEVGWEAGIALAQEKGPAPIMEEEFKVTEEMLVRRPEMRRDGYAVGDKVKGKVLLARYSRYMQQFDAALTDRIATHGARFTHHSSIAPTGTISLSLANNASNGIEPSFAHKYSRNVLREGKKSKERVEVFSYELLAYRTLMNPDADPDAEDGKNQLPDYFITADHINPREHVDVQAAAQKWVDSSISKTANVPTDYPYGDFKDIYQYAYEKGLKGCTTFRFNPEAFQGVLVKDKDLENTTYRFQLANGEVVEVKGNEEIEYDGEMHTAANLYDALKEGYYGRF